MAELTLQKISKAATTITYASASTDGDTFKAVPGAFIHAKNASDSATRSIAVAVVNTPLDTPEAGSITLANLVIVVPISGEKMFSVPPAYQGPGGLVSMVYTSNADLTLAALYAGQ